VADRAGEPAAERAGAVGMCARPRSSATSARSLRPMGARRNLVAVLLVSAGATLFGLALIDWIFYYDALAYHAMER
jgi:hypothetical protein